MPIEVKVDPPGIIISQGRTFMVTNSAGEINRQTNEGVLAGDTRFISHYHLFINREPWTLINSSQLSFYASRTYLTNPQISTEDGDIAENTIGLTLERTVEHGIHEDFYIVNYTAHGSRYGCDKVHFVSFIVLLSSFHHSRLVSVCTADAMMRYN